MLVKIFKNKNRENQEAAINEFLRINPVKICHVTQSESQGTTSTGENVTISIFYE